MKRGVEPPRVAWLAPRPRGGPSAAAPRRVPGRSTPVALPGRGAAAKTAWGQRGGSRAVLLRFLAGALRNTRAEAAGRVGCAPRGGAHPRRRLQPTTSGRKRAVAVAVTPPRQGSSVCCVPPLRNINRAGPAVSRAPRTLAVLLRPRSMRRAALHGGAKRPQAWRRGAPLCDALRCAALLAGVRCPDRRRGALHGGAERRCALRCSARRRGAPVCAALRRGAPASACRHALRSAALHSGAERRCALRCPARWRGAPVCAALWRGALHGGAPPCLWRGAPV